MAHSQFRISRGLRVRDIEVIDDDGNIVAPSIVQTLQSLTDVDFNNLVDDGVLMYKQSAGKWVITKDFDTHNIDAGHY